MKFENSRGMDSNAARLHTLELFAGTDLPDPSRFMIATPMRFPAGNGNGW